jgi:hypothetical protein
MYYRQYGDIGCVYRQSKNARSVCVCVFVVGWGGGELEVNKDSLREKQRSIVCLHGNAPAEGEDTL